MITTKFPSKYRNGLTTALLFFCLTSFRLFAGEGWLNHFSAKTGTDPENGTYLFFTKEQGPYGPAWENKTFIIYEREAPGFFSVAKAILEGAWTNNNEVYVWWDETLDDPETETIEGVTKLFSKDLARYYSYSDEKGLSVTGNILIPDPSVGVLNVSFSMEMYKGPRMWAMLHQLPVINHARPENINYPAYKTNSCMLGIIKGEELLGFQAYGAEHQLCGAISNSPKGWLVQVTSDNGASYATLYESQNPSFFSHVVNSLTRLSTPGKGLTLAYSRANDGSGELPVLRSGRLAKFQPMRAGPQN